MKGKRGWHVTFKDAVITCYHLKSGLLYCTVGLAHNFGIYAHFILIFLPRVEREAIWEPNSYPLMIWPVGWLIFGARSAQPVDIAAKILDPSHCSGMNNKTVKSKMLADGFQIHFPLGLCRDNHSLPKHHWLKWAGLQTKATKTFVCLIQCFSNCGAGRINETLSCCRMNVEWLIFILGHARKKIQHHWNLYIILGVKCVI